MNIEERLILGQIDTTRAVEETAQVIRDVGPDDIDRLRDIGLRVLAPVLSRAQPAAWLRIEHETRRSLAFRRALSFACQAAFSPREEARSLLQNLGQLIDVTVSFVANVVAEDGTNQFEWSSLEVRPALDRFGIAQVLRSIADDLDFGVTDPSLPRTMKQLDAQTLVRLDQASREPFDENISSSVQRVITPGPVHVIRALLGPDVADPESRILFRVYVLLATGERAFLDLILHREDFEALPGQVAESDRRDLLRAEASMPSLAAWFKAQRNNAT